MSASVVKQRSPVLVFVFSHNDEATIEGYLASLDEALGRARTSLVPIVYVLPNGCRDATAARARDALAKFRFSEGAFVEEIALGGKANAWNHAVHEIAPRHRGIEFALFLDSDIDLCDTELSLLVELLQEEPGVAAATSQPKKKRVEFSLTGVVPFVLSRSSQTHQDGVICGQLYAIRTEDAARIWMPRGLLVEDGFLAACLRTRMFSTDPVDSLIRAHRGVHHYFDVESTLHGAVKHEERTELGSHMNFVAFDLLWQADDATALLEQKYEQNPSWLIEEFERAVAVRGRRVFRWSRMFESFQGIRPGVDAPRRCVMASLRTVQRSAALWGAYRRVLRGDMSW